MNKVDKINSLNRRVDNLKNDLEQKVMDYNKLVMYYREGLSEIILDIILGKDIEDIIHNVYKLFDCNDNNLKVSFKYNILNIRYDFGKVYIQFNIDISDPKIHCYITRFTYVNDKIDKAHDLLKQLIWLDLDYYGNYNDVPKFNELMIEYKKTIEDLPLCFKL